jgi:2-polyprenyl-3-methyl-5-hydroxy-6-metoxy-1,4-benzoquinol methylase
MQETEQQQAPGGINEQKLNDFVMKMVGEMSGAVTCATVALGDKLGLYKALDGAGPTTAARLAETSGANQRLIQEWLNAQTAAGYLTYDPQNATYELPAEHAMALANEDSPVFLAGGMDVVSAMWRAEEKLIEGMKTGKGMGWHEHAPRLFVGTERFFRPGYRTFLTSAWIPALEGVVQKLEAGAKVADIGCGLGASTIIMAQTYPNSKFYGFDYHDDSIKLAKDRGKDAKVKGIKFEKARATDYKEGEFDLICFFDCLHDMGDPIGVARHARHALKEDGTVLLVEPNGKDTVEENIGPLGALFYGASVFLCTPNAINQGGDPVLGAQAGEHRLREVFQEAGFSRFRRATETPFNLVLEARP